MQTKIKLILAGVVCTIIGVAFTTLTPSDDLNNEKSSPENNQDDAGLSITQFQKTSTRNGKKEWQISAASAKFIRNQKKAVFKDIDVTFYLENDDSIQLKAQKGILYTDSNNIEAAGDVIVKNKELQLKTQQLNYEHQRRIIHSDKPIFISGGAITLSADSMSLELNTQKAQLQGNVKSSVDENDFL